MIENLLFAKYEVEPSPLPQYILSRKQASMLTGVTPCFLRLKIHYSHNVYNDVNIFTSKTSLSFPLLRYLFQTATGVLSLPIHFDILKEAQIDQSFCEVLLLSCITLTFGRIFPSASFESNSWMATEWDSSKCCLSPKYWNRVSVLWGLPQELVLWRLSSISITIIYQFHNQLDASNLNQPSNRTK
jgi:hypothetical protein